MDIIYLYFKGPLESKCQFLTNGREKIEIETLKKSKDIH